MEKAMAFRYIFELFETVTYFGSARNRFTQILAI